MLCASAPSVCVVSSLRNCLVLSPPRFSFSSPLEEEPSDVCEEEPHLRLRHGIHHQRHAHRGQSDVEERHGVACPHCERGNKPACMCMPVGEVISLLIGKELQGNNAHNNHQQQNPFLKLFFRTSGTSPPTMSTETVKPAWGVMQDSSPFTLDRDTQGLTLHITLCRVCFPDAMQ